MGAAWREVHDGDAFDAVLDMVQDVAALGMEVCTTLGMLTADQAQRLKSAGLTAYNHNLDTSPEFYPKIITTRTYQDRLDTLRHVQDAGLSVCCGGIIGMGESPRDRCAMLAQLGRLDPHPESLPVNVLVRTAGTPLADADDLDPIELVRTIALRAARRAEGARAAVGRTARAVGRSAGVVFRRRRQLDLLRREAADLAQSDRRRRSAADGQAGPSISGMTARQEFEDRLAATLAELRRRGPAAADAPAERHRSRLERLPRACRASVI